MDNKQPSQNVINQNSTITNQYNIACHNYEVNQEIGNITNHIDFHVPKKNESFFGRDTELNVFEEWFTSGEQRMIVVCGCAGYGKSELVKQFVHRSRDGGTVAHVLWMDAETSDKLLQSFKDLAQVLRLPQVDDASLIQSVFSRIESTTGRSLMVLDNAENRRSILSFEPEGRTMCVVTSRMQDWDDVRTLRLTPLLAAGALALLLDKLPGADKQELSVLAAALSRVPLALHVAAGYVRQEIRALGSLFNLPNYVQQIQESCDSLIDTPLPSSSANTYDKTLAQAIHISLKKIQNSNLPNSKLAWKILHVLAYLYSEKINVDDLLCIFSLDEVTESDISRAHTLLQDYSLITFDDFIKIHRFIQSTLVAFQNQNNLEIFYMTCLQLLFVTNRTSSFHKYFILSNVDKNSDIFTKFYIDNKNKILNHKIFFTNLISTGCYIGLEKILTDLGGCATDVINKLCLLHKAISHRQHDVLKLLLARGGHVDHKDDDHSTALHLAVDMLDLRAVKILTSHNADVNVSDGQDRSVLERLVEASVYIQNVGRSEEACEVLRWLAECGARTDVVTPNGVTLLHMAARTLNADVVRCLVCKFRLDVNAADVYNWTPLHNVSLQRDINKSRRLRTAACLLELGARRDVVDSHGRTPGQLALLWGLEFLASYLDNPSPECLPQQDSLFDVLRAAAGAGDVSSLRSKLDELEERAVQAINESCLLHLAVELRRYDVLELLLTRGAYVDHRDERNDTALHLAADMIDLCAVEILTLYKADVNTTGCCRMTVLQLLILASGREQNFARSEELCTVLRRLMRRGARTNVVTLIGKTLLHLTASVHLVDLVSCLVSDFGLNVNAVDKNSATPLHCISYGESTDKDKMRRTAVCLLEHGARRDVVDSQGRTPAQVAQANGHKWFAAWLDNGQDTLVNLLRAVAGAGEMSLLTSKLDELGECAVQVINESCLLHVTIQQGRHSVLELLLKRGAYVDHRDEYNVTALHLAVFQLDLCAMQILATHNADVFATSGDDKLLLHRLAEASGSTRNIARSVESCEVLRWLVEHGARTDVVTPNGVTLLHVAAEACSADLVRCIVCEFGLNVHAVDVNSATPLHYVSFNVRTDKDRMQRTAACLLDLGARLDVVDSQGRTPAQVARENGHEWFATWLDKEQDSVVALLRVAASVGDVSSLTSILDELGERAVQVINKSCLLHFAVQQGRHDVLELLLTRGGQVDHRDEYNSTALHLAVDRLDLCAVQILTAHNADVNNSCLMLQRLIEALSFVQNFDRSDDMCSVLRWLVRRGMRTDVVTPDGQTLLHLAAAALSVDLVRCLVCEFGLNVNAVDVNCWTPLHRVSDGVCTDIDKIKRTAACLLDLCARRDVMDLSGRTPAQLARVRKLGWFATWLDNKQDSLADVLRAAANFADLSLLTSKLDELEERAVQVISKSCLLHWAVQEGRHDVLELLLAQGGQLDLRDEYNSTALHRAVDRIDLRAVQILTAHNADVNATDGNGRSVLQRLILSSHRTQNISRQVDTCAVLRWLAGRGALTDVVTPDGMTLLHLAARIHNADLVRCLVCEFRLNVNSASVDIWTPLHYVSIGVGTDKDKMRNAAECLLILGARRDVVDLWGHTPAQLARVRGLEWFATWLEHEQNVAADTMEMTAEMLAEVKPIAEMMTTEAVVVEATLVATAADGEPTSEMMMPKALAVEVEAVVSPAAVEVETWWRRLSDSFSRAVCRCGRRLHHVSQEWQTSTSLYNQTKYFEMTACHYPVLGMACGVRSLEPTRYLIIVPRVSWWRWPQHSFKARPELNHGFLDHGTYLNFKTLPCRQAEDYRNVMYQ